MNPLDKEEFADFLQTMKNDMPLHTETSAKIKFNYSNRMPKSAVDLSQKVDNKFLNDNLHTIEEMEYRQKGITDNFRNYQIKQYGKSDILNHDLYFEHDGKIIPKVSGAQPMIMNPFRFPASCTEGTELSVGGIGAHSEGNNNYFFASKVVGASTDLCYDQIACNAFAGNGNWVMGAYTGDADAPNALMSQITAITTLPTDFSYNTLPEFTSASATFWLAVNQDTLEGQFYYNPSPTSTGYYKALTYNATMPDPAPSPETATDSVNMKVTHS